MIDTITIQFNLNYDLNQFVQKGIRNYIIPLSYQPFINGKRQVGIYTCSIFPFSSIRFDARHGYIQIMVSTIPLLRHEATSNDISTIEESVISFFEGFFHTPIQYVDGITLNRIDYKVDYRVKSSIETKIFYDLLSIAPEKFDGVVKTQRKTAVKYCPKNGYIELISYDKEKELCSKLCKKSPEEVFASNESLEDYIGVIRTEVRVKNRKLNYNKKKFGLSKDLANYLDEYSANYYFEKYAQKIWFSEPFYRIDVALSKIRNCSNLKDNMKSKLCNLLSSINILGITGAMKLYKNKSTFNSHIKKIRALNINPLTFSSSYNVEKISNFSLRRNKIG